MDFETFYTRFRKAEKDNPDTPFLIHFRIATHGTVDLYNCHPFIVDSEHSFIHNGVIAGMSATDKNDNRSDTRIFNDTILRKLPIGWEKNEAIVSMIESRIGISKLCLLSIDGTVTIFNEEKGHWKDGIWFSNYGYTTRWASAKTPISGVEGNVFGFRGHQTHTSYGKADVLDLTKDTPGKKECEWCSNNVRKKDIKHITIDGVECNVCTDCYFDMKYGLIEGIHNVKLIA